MIETVKIFERYDHEECSTTRLKVVYDDELDSHVYIGHTDPHGDEVEMNLHSDELAALLDILNFAYGDQIHGA
ncbi:hypothetical protein ACFV98_11635 [Streptomyces violascens]|uniref:hypothetical protein n=1 Tax=Streptomyces violascens TaxID=67381 RepID=UPI00364B639A